MDIRPALRYNYERDENGLRGSLRFPGIGDSEHLSIPIGIIIVREHHDDIPYYAENDTYEYDAVDDELFDKLLDKCSKPIGKENTRKIREMHTKTKKNKKST